MENYTRIIGATSTNITTPTVGQINQGNDTLTPYDSAKNNGYYNEMSRQIGNISEELTTLISAAGLTPDATLGQVLESIPLIATPITTRGDIIRGDVTGKQERLGIGAVNSILISDGTDIFYETQPALDGTNFINTGGVAQATTTAGGKSFLPNQITISNGTDTDHDIDFTAGNFIFSGGDGQAVASALTKQIDATWAAGDAAGGLADALTVAPDTTYYCFALSNASGSSVDFGFDTSLTATNLLADAAVVVAGLTKYKKIASLLTDSSANILTGDYDFRADGSYDFNYNAVIQDLNSSVTTTGASLTLSTPPSTKALIEANFIFTNGSDTLTIFKGSSASGSTQAIFSLSSSSTNFRSGINTSVYTNASSQIFNKMTGATRTVIINTLGWSDNNL